MKNKTIFQYAIYFSSITIIWLLIIVCNQQHKSEKKIKLHAESYKYLNQKLPGKTPEVFAPGFISNENTNELNAVFSSDYREFYYSVRRPCGRHIIMLVKRNNGNWSNPQIAPFSGIFSEADPFITYDGKKMFYASKRPGREIGPPHDIWIMDKTENGWSEPYNPGTPINTEANEIYPSLTKEGTLYFNSNRDGGFGGRDIYRSRLIDGVYVKSENLGGSISTMYDEGDVFIAADESYIIFVSSDRPDGFGSGDLYISFKNTNGSWTEAKNMGFDINSEGYDYCPIVSPDGKYFFFTKKNDIYWVDAGIIEDLK